MKKRSLTLGILALSMLPFTASAMDFVPDSVAMGYGYFLRNKADLHNYRVGLRWDWNRDWLEYKENLVLTGYTEVAVSYLDSHLATPTTNVESDGQIYAFSFSPVLRLKHKTTDYLHFFIDAGAGVSIQTEKNIDQKGKSAINMGGHVQFEISAMAGARFGDRLQCEVAAGLIHYSNGYLHDSNEGLDFAVVQLAYHW